MKINIWKYIVLFQVGKKAFKLIKTYKARKLNKKKINTNIVAAYDDL